MKTKKYIKTLICVLFTLSSCTDMLELTPYSNLTNESFWKTEDDAKAGLTSAYVYLRAQASLNLFIWGEARSDVMEWGKVSGTLDYDIYYNNTLSSVSAGPTWQGLYTTVNAVNLVITKVPNIEIANATTKDNILAQAYAMRAYLYFVMARTWGGVPLRTTPSEGYNPEKTQVARANVEDIFQLIKEDLDKAISLFGEDKSIPTGRNRWSRAGAYALKADVYLWTAKRMNGGDSDLVIALDACDKVAESDVSLLTNYADLFEYDKKGNKEFIMAVGFKELEPSSGNMLFNNMYSGPTASSTDPINGQIIGQNSGGVVWTMTSDVRNQFTSDDKRKNATFATLPSFPNHPAVLRKGRGIRIGTTRYFSSDYIIYRYADVLLMKAEIKNALGQDPTEEMKKIRERAYGSMYSSYAFVNGTKEQNDEAILKERLLELATEGKRWWDLVRFDKIFEIVPSLAVHNTEEGKERYYLWPLSLDVLSKEVKVEQTPGWW